MDCSATKDDIVKHASKALRSGKSPSEVAKILTTFALDKHSLDNIVVIVVTFQWA